MPKVGTQQFNIKGTLERFDVYYSSKSGFYYKDFPQEIQDLGNPEQRFERFETEAELHKSTFSKIIRYHKAIESNKKVIVYSLALPNQIKMNKVGRGHYQGTSQLIPEKMQNKIEGLTGEGFGFLLNFEILIKVEGSETTYYFADTFGKENHRHRPSSKTFEIEWTEEREAFFEGLKQQTTNMAQMIVEFLSKDEQQLLQIFDRGAGNLLGS